MGSGVFDEVWPLTNVLVQPNVRIRLLFLKKKVNGTRRASQAVPHPSTDRAFGCLTSEFRWDRVYSTEYGRWRKGTATNWLPPGGEASRLFALRARLCGAVGGRWSSLCQRQPGPPGF